MCPVMPCNNNRNVTKVVEKHRKDVFPVSSSAFYTNVTSHLNKCDIMSNLSKTT